MMLACWSFLENTVMEEKTATTYGRRWRLIQDIRRWSCGSFLLHCSWTQQKPDKSKTAKYSTCFEMSIQLRTCCVVHFQSIKRLTFSTVRISLFFFICQNENNKSQQMLQWSRRNKVQSKQNFVLFWCRSKLLQKNCSCILKQAGCWPHWRWRIATEPGGRDIPRPHCPWDGWTAACCPWTACCVRSSVPLLQSEKNLLVENQIYIYILCVPKPCQISQLGQNF